MTINTRRRAAINAAGVSLGFALVGLGLAVQIPIIDLQTLGIATVVVALTVLLISEVRLKRSQKSAPFYKAGLSRSNPRHIPLPARRSNIAGSMVR